MNKNIIWPWPALHGPRAALWLASLHTRTKSTDCLVEAAAFLQPSTRNELAEGHRKPDSPLWKGTPEQRFAACLNALQTLDKHTTTNLADAEALRRTAFEQNDSEGWLAGRLNQATTLAHADAAVFSAAQTASTALDRLGEALEDIEAAASRNALQTHAAWRVAVALTADPETLGKTFALGGTPSGHGQGALGLGNALSALLWIAALDLVLQNTGQLEQAEAEQPAQKLNRWTAAAAACGDGSLKSSAALLVVQTALTKEACPWWLGFLLQWLAEQLSPPLAAADTPFHLGDPLWRYTPDALALLEALQNGTPTKRIAEKPAKKLAFDLERREDGTPDSGTPEGLKTFLGLAAQLAEQLLASPHVLTLCTDAELRDQLAPHADPEIIAAEALLEISSTSQKLAAPQGRTVSLEQSEGRPEERFNLETLPLAYAETFGTSLARIAVKYTGLFAAAKWGLADADDIARQTERGLWPEGTTFISLIEAWSAETTALVATTLNRCAGLPTPRTTTDHLWPAALVTALNWTRWIRYAEGDNLFVKVRMPTIHPDLEDADGQPWTDLPIVEDILRPAVFATLCAMWDSSAAFSALNCVGGRLLRLQTPKAVAARQKTTAASRAAVHALLTGQSGEAVEVPEAWMLGVSLVDFCGDAFQADDDADDDADDGTVDRRKTKPWISTLTIAGKTACGAQGKPAAEGAAEGGSLAKLGQIVQEARWTWLSRQASDGFPDLVLLRSDASN